jgi:hypothetical protein
MLSIVPGCAPLEPATLHAHQPVPRSQCLVRGCKCMSLIDNASVCACGHGSMYHKAPTTVAPVATKQPTLTVDRLIDKAVSLDRRAGMKEAKGGLLQDSVVLQEAFQLLVMTLEAYEAALDECNRSGDSTRVSDIKLRMKEVVGRCDTLTAMLRSPPPPVLPPPPQHDEHVVASGFSYGEDTQTRAQAGGLVEQATGQAVEITDDSMRLRSPKVARRPTTVPQATQEKSAIKQASTNNKLPKKLKKGNTPTPNTAATNYHPLTPSELTDIIKKSRHQKSLASWRPDHKN